MTEFMHQPLEEVAEALRAGRTSAEALAEEAIARYDHLDPVLGAYKTWDPDGALAQARTADAAFAAGLDSGPLQGIPISVKDIYGVKDLPTYAGSPRRLPEEWEAEGPVIQALRRQAAVITGKTHTVEFAFGGLGTNTHWGTPRNPWDAKVHRVPGGSSSGAGVSLCEGSAFLALGSDTGGSIRIPASMTGNVGLKTTVGRWSTAGIVPLSPTYDTAGLLARSVADIAFAFPGIDPECGDIERFRQLLASVEVAGLRLGICDDLFWDDCSPGVAEGVKAALDEVAARGAKLVRIALPEAAEASEIYFKVGRGGIAAERSAFLSSRLPEWLGSLDPVVTGRISASGGMPAGGFSNLRSAKLAASAGRRLAAVDLLASPTVPVTPPAVAEVTGMDGYHSMNMRALKNTSIANMFGMCALTLPVARDQAGMPVGLQLMARHGADERLLALGLAIEKTLGTARERLGTPPLCRP